MRIEYEPRFLDEAVLRAAGARPEGRLFWRERERVHRLADPEERTRAFDALNLAWCARLDLARPIDAALAEQPLVCGGVGRCAIGRPPSWRDAGAELFVRPDPAGVDRLLRLLFAPELLLEPHRLLIFLRRELLHVADMLDPAFGYEPRLGGAGVGGYEHLLRDRYRVVWSATVDGRLMRVGVLPPRVRAAREAEFRRTFAALGDAAGPAFAAFFDTPRPTHAAIAAFVTAPHCGVERRAGSPWPCALCGFPTTDGVAAAGLSAGVQAEIARDYPTWTAAAGCCRQCADLYRARPLSTRAAATLPRIR